MRLTIRQTVPSDVWEIKDPVLVPGPKDHWFDNGALWVG